VGHYVAGPFCAKVLAAFGAEVIKVEKPQVGDPSRRMGPFFKKGPVTERSGLYFHLNTAKKGITLDLKHVRGKEIFRELVKDADVVVENFRPGALAELGLGYEALRETNPRVIVTSISGLEEQ
jgi:formyl-CoA transferase